MAIADDDLERIRSAVSIVDLIGQHVQLKRTGRNWVGLCPFHAERTPSFNVREETGRYRCFGCDKSGDVFTFVQCLTFPVRVSGSRLSMSTDSSGSGGGGGTRSITW